MIISLSYIYTNFLIFLIYLELETNMTYVIFCVDIFIGTFWFFTHMAPKHMAPKHMRLQTYGAPKHIGPLNTWVLQTTGPPNTKGLQLHAPTPKHIGRPNIWGPQTHGAPKHMGPTKTWGPKHMALKHVMVHGVKQSN